jgi:hypothetical protein
MRKEEAGSSKQMVLEEANISKSIPAGSKTSIEIASPTPKLVMKKDGATAIFALWLQRSSRFTFESQKHDSTSPLFAIKPVVCNVRTSLKYSG